MDNNIGDMRDFLGKGADAGQKLDLYITGGISVGNAKFLDVAKDRVAAEGDVNLFGYEGKAFLKVTITGPGTCHVELVAGGTKQEDKNATYVDKNGGREVTCKLFPDHFDAVWFVLWRDGLYTNTKVSMKKGIFWTPPLHLWAHPAAAQYDALPAAISSEPLSAAAV
jgi:hypothetical protein